MKTREKILHTALEQFNTQGIQEVSLRDIANEINISVGNLNYHFPTTNDIIYALSLQLVDDVNKAIENHMAVPATDSLLSLYQMMETTFNSHIKYRFLFNSRHAEIITSIPEMQNYYQETFENHFIQGKHIFEQLVREGFLNDSILPHLNGFTYVQNALGLFWQQELAIFQPKLSNKKKIEHAMTVLFVPYRPYLTKKGEATLIPLLKELKPYKKGGLLNK
ncbi:MAG: TetR/AcrR family transcriptional regulator [Crocinitomicaceae bacterium]|nr:TetR/AcrR family transcriptional regulator [Crocinitomicaceae bacterium]